MKKIIITGGCGFIGINLVQFLLETKDGISIRIVDNLSVGTPEDLALVCQYRSCGSDIPTHWAPGVDLIQGDIRDSSLALGACAGADGVVHLAANTGVIPSIENPRHDCEMNVLGTFNFLEGCRTHGVKRFVLASSGAPLGEQEPPIHEEMVTRPISPYGASKLCGEAYCSAYHGSYGVETACLRFGNVYGPYSNHKGSVAALFIRQILAGETLTIYGDGTQTRDFIAVEDLAGAIWAALTTTGTGGEVFQIATHREHTVIELAEELKLLATELAALDIRLAHAPVRPGEVQRNYSDISKAKKILKWSPTIEFRDGLRQTFQWFLDQQ
ncbi:MAG: GDP-mannose 4,6-dehydratase [Proteobacteria bacterium]|nr:GDP-mannose 4,6-dehydratase [Pseudomonadota bacterium]